MGDRLQINGLLIIMLTLNVCIVLLAGCSRTAVTPPQGRLEQSTAKTNQAPPSKYLIDPERYQKAEIVLVGKSLAPGEGSKYYWHTVVIESVLKNRTSISLSNTIEAARLPTEPDVPMSNSVLYLTWYGRLTNTAVYWRLLSTNLPSVE